MSIGLHQIGGTASDQMELLNDIEGQNDCENGRMSAGIVIPAFDAALQL
jgi:hypothetical protein